MNGDLKNPFGLLNNDPKRIVRVEDVPSGIACNCWCPHCGSQFIAVKSGRRIPHFRHHNSEDCGASFESAVHLMAKKVLVETKKLMLPYLKVRPSRRDLGTFNIEKYVRRRAVMVFDAVDEEIWMEGRRPDIVMWKNGHRLLVEIVVTHDITADKYQWIKDRDLATVRVWLSWVGYDISEDVLKRCLHSGYAITLAHRPNIVQWVHHPKEARAQVEIEQAYLDEAYNQTIKDTPYRPSAEDIGSMRPHRRVIMKDGEQLTLDFAATDRTKRR